MIRDGWSLNEGSVEGYEEDRNAILLNCNSHLQPSRPVPDCLWARPQPNYPRTRFEVIAVDHGGTTALDEIVARFHGVLFLRLLRQENTGPAAARNREGSEAKVEFLVFRDDDCSPAPKWLQALAAQFVAANCAVGGQTVHALTHNLYFTVSQLLISYLFSYYNVVPRAARFSGQTIWHSRANGFVQLEALR